jgi:hypothetical protein
MQLKPITGIMILLLVVAPLLVAGCVSTPSDTNQTPSASATLSTATHDAFLEKYLATYKSTSYVNKNTSIKAWEVTWINGTSARLEWTVFGNSTNGTYNYQETYLVFPTTQDSTNYLTALNKTAYSLVNTIYPDGGAYQNLTGHAPQIYKLYQWNEGSPIIISEYKYHQISQIDNIVIVTTGKQVS